MCAHTLTFRRLVHAHVTMHLSHPLPGHRDETGPQSLRRLRARAPQRHSDAHSGAQQAAWMSSLGSEGPDDNSLQGLGMRSEYWDYKDGSLETLVQPPV